MIGSIDILASIRSSPVASIAMTGRLSGIDFQPPLAFAAFLRAGDFSSLIRKVVARKARKMTPPAARNVPRMPMMGGSAPPISGPTRLPAMIPEDSTPSAQAERSFGVCVATSTIEPEA